MRASHLVSREASLDAREAMAIVRPIMQIVSLSGSPSSPSRSSFLLRTAEQRLAPHARRLEHVSLRELPPAALVHADVREVHVREAIDLVLAADLVLVATPIYKAAYSGLLKLFLDLLPEEALRGKTVLPLATGGSLGHLLALDYALKPVLSALGARHILDPLFATDAQIAKDPERGYVVEPALTARLDRALQGLFDTPRRVAVAA